MSKVEFLKKQGFPAMAENAAGGRVKFLQDSLDGDEDAIKKTNELIESGKTFGQQVLEARGNPELLQQLADGAEDTVKTVAYGGERKFEKPQKIISGLGKRHPTDLERKPISVDDKKVA